MKKKKLFLFFLFLGISVVYSQDTLFVMHGKISGSGFDYYFNSDERTRMTFNNTNGFYILPVTSDSIKSIHISLTDDNTCEQYLDVVDLLAYCTSHKTKKIVNDLTYLGSCMKIDAIPDDQDGHFAGEWESPEHKLAIYSNLDFTLDFTTSSGDFRREGKVEVINDTTFVLHSLFIINETTQTFENSSTLIKLKQKEDSLTSLPEKISLSKLK